MRLTGRMYLDELLSLHRYVYNEIKVQILGAGHSSKRDLKVCQSRLYNLQYTEQSYKIKKYKHMHMLYRMLSAIARCFILRGKEWLQRSFQILAEFSALIAPGRNSSCNQ